MDAYDSGWFRARPPTEAEQEQRPLKVVFASPAEHFTDAAPIGNGSLGAMVWGGVASEKLQLNHDTLWTGVPGNYTDPNVPSALAVVRGLVDEGRFVDATKAASGLFGGPTQMGASSSFNGPFVNPLDSKVDPASAALRTLNKISNVTFSQLRAAHLEDYQSLFHRVSLQLSQALTMERPNIGEAGEAIETTAERINRFRCDQDPSLVELLFQYGRYLLISSSRPGTQVSNLQGIWNQDLEPAWEASPHLNINLQMNYWLALPCNLSECQDPLFDFIASLACNGTETAKVNYQACGWVTHHDTDIWAKSSAYYEDAMYAVWPMGGAWLCTHLWEHYQYSLDKEFLENTAYPLLEGCALFLVDWLIEGPRGYLETNPSTSPEHCFIAPGGGGYLASVSYSTTMDISIIREIFLAVISSSKVLGKSDTTLIKRIKKALPRLPPIAIGKDNTIMEWAQDFEDPEVHHRHLSHLFGLYPGHTITMEKNPEICNAVTNSLYKRGQDGPGWSSAWKMALWARLLNSENAYKMVLKFITLVPPGVKVGFEGGLYSNLWTAHPPFQIDANFGFTAAIAEMLLQSTLTDLYLLPALPRDKWPKGCVKGLRARGNVTVNICWKEGELEEALLWCNNKDSVLRLHYGGQVTTTTVSGGKAYKFSGCLQCIATWPLEK
ncbi:hypothetical protein ACP70R_021461 [Stipagrostis hirtigluma subsp. patula]